MARWDSTRLAGTGPENSSSCLAEATRTEMRRAMRYRLARATYCSLAFMFVASICRAQTAPPTLEKVKPSGGERGKRVTVVVQGTNIAGATRMLFSEPGLSSEITATKEIPIEKPEMPKGVVRTDAPIEDKAKKYEITALVTIGQ